MSSPPPFSVIVPVHNGARFLREALDSVAGQSIDDWECIVVDDASTDPSLEIAASWARAHGAGRVHIMENPAAHARGVARSRNLAIAEAAHQWIAFLDQDDTWHPRKLERQARFVEEHPGITAVGCLFDLVFDGVEAVPFFESWWASVQSLGQGPSALLGIEDFVNGCPYCLSGVIASKAALTGHGGFVPDLRWTSDWAMWSRLAYDGALGLVCEPLVRYRVHGANEMQRLVRHPLGLTKAFIEVRTHVAAWLVTERGWPVASAKDYMDRLTKLAASRSRPEAATRRSAGSSGGLAQ